MSGFETGEVWLTLAPEYGGERETLIETIPENPGDRFSVAYETQRLVQRAYAMGRKHQAEIDGRELHTLDLNWKKMIRKMEDY